MDVTTSAAVTLRRQKTGNSARQARPPAAATEGWNTFNVNLYDKGIIDFYLGSDSRLLACSYLRP